MKNTLIIFTFLTSFYYSRAQTGEIWGKVTDQFHEGVSKATIEITTTSGEPVDIKNKTTDYDGNFELKPLKPGSYTLIVKHSSCSSKTAQNLLVSADKTTFINFELLRKETTKKQKTKKFKR